VTAHCVEDHHFDAVFAAYVEDDAVLSFFEENNPAALMEMSERLLEAQRRELWRPRSNDAPDRLREVVAARPARTDE
jgi:cobaltochelatase CobN